MLVKILIKILIHVHFISWKSNINYWLIKTLKKGLWLVKTLKIKLFFFSSSRLTRRFIFRVDENIGYFQLSWLMKIGEEVEKDRCFGLKFRKWQIQLGKGPESEIMEEKKQRLPCWWGGRTVYIYNTMPSLILAILWLFAFRTGRNWN